MEANPLSDETKELFECFNLKVDSIFHNICNNVDPLYQTFSRPQDRNRMLIPYSFVRMQVILSYNSWICMLILIGTSMESLYMDFLPVRFSLIQLTSSSYAQPSTLRKWCLGEPSNLLAFKRPSNTPLYAVPSQIYSPTNKIRTILVPSLSSQLISFTKPLLLPTNI